MRTVAYKWNQNVLLGKSNTYQEGGRGEGILYCIMSYSLSYITDIANFTLVSLIHSAKILYKYKGAILKKNNPKFLKSKDLKIRIPNRRT